MHPGESIAKIKFAVIDKAGSGDNELIAAVPPAALSKRTTTVPPETRT